MCLHANCIKYTGGLVAVFWIEVVDCWVGKIMTVWIITYDFTSTFENYLIK